MAKGTAFVCRACGARSPGPLGRCPRCGGWGTVAEEERSALTPPAGHTRVIRLGDVDEIGIARIPSGNAEVDRVLGGGWVAGAALLLAGEPGIGKSTLLLQLADAAARANRRVVVVCGEESPAQVKLRAVRLGVAPSVELLSGSDAHALARFLVGERPALVIVDSIQTLTIDGGGAPGSPTAVRDATAVLVQAAKESATTLVLIGHVTKQGSIAGPKVIEHVVDATLALESAGGFRVLRGIKNRFGPGGEVGVFEMHESGMRPVANPSDLFLAERPVGVPGSVVVAALEGQRPLLVEVQALAAASPYPAPRRVVQGLDARRVDVVLAVLERRMRLPLAGLDVFVNVAGGLRLTDPGVDLAVAAAVHGAVTNRSVAAGTAVFGEVGLAGELRAVTQGGRRAAEAARAQHPDVVGPRGGGETATWRTAVDLQEAFAALWGER